MNKRDKELALKASDSKTGWLDRQKFADLIHADEREACAKFLERIDLGNLPPDLALHYGLLINSLVAGIRARGEQ
ncbi:hypothetical protein UFOVP907_3 [uncultured Caudovirales phage]|uniref:Uncharacterized protein n=1 Tax=uncultured Caudovirales phage TaxID=2100421 RepID=A0A6J5PIG9_9CAUD|nr:hypothetical protein UFOVP907_3 [uncultured Caudovirales phage]